jgi:SecD/SecF fusion protein
MLASSLFGPAIAMAQNEPPSPAAEPAATAPAAPSDAAKQDADAGPATEGAASPAPTSTAPADPGAAATPAATTTSTPPADGEADTSSAKDAAPASTDSGAAQAPPPDAKPIDAAAPAPPTGETPLESTMPPGKTEPSLAAKAADAAGADEAANGGSTWHTLGLGIGILALLVIPVWLGNALARYWKMPDHGWKFSLVLLALAVSVTICVFGTFKFGPDLSGGITLIYELADTAELAKVEGPNARPKSDAKQEEATARRKVEQADLIGSLKKRLDPDGTKEIVVREYGPAVEIIIPETGGEEMEAVKRLITRLGSLEFRITADPTVSKEKEIIELAKKLAPYQKNVMIGDQKVAEWVAYDAKEFGPVTEEGRVVKRMSGDTPEALVLIDPWNVTGDYITSATKGMDDRGGPAVHFAFNREGARRFQQLTGRNKPNPATPNVYRDLGIILDKILRTAPRIETTISDRGMISGGSMTEKEVEETVEVLNAGSLPAALNKTPISEEVISPTLGQDTIEKGTRAILISFIAVMLFMLVYYRFAGVVACIALLLNLLLVVALMNVIGAAFTLPGLAGIVLTIGMAVDANVLIYERIREELRSGAALRMAIRNGFSRAMTAIIDSNVTTIITGIVLFYLGTDQVKGFAVTLILGLATSMFTAIFVARLIFDVAERRGWITNLYMMKLLSNPNVDFLGKRWAAITASLILIGIGTWAVVQRGSQLLDIDFTGGSSVTFTLKPTNPMSVSDVRKSLADSELADRNLVVVERGETRTRYTIDTSEQDVQAVKHIVQEKFGDKLMKYAVNVGDVTEVKEGDATGVEAKLTLNTGDGFEDDEGVSQDALRDSLAKILSESGHNGVLVSVTNPNYKPGSNVRFKEWTVRFTGLDPAAARNVLQKLQNDMQATPMFPLANQIGGRVSQQMQTNALIAIGVSLVAVVVYLWLRFQKVYYGLAAAVAVAHDVLVTIGMLALSFYIVSWIPGLADFLRIDAFQINLTIIAALLTIIGYSLNDTIVTFDRLREIKGKSPNLMPQMVNSAVNQCLSRTILTALTVFIVVVILYFFGGEGIHSFAYAFLVGVVAGTYSTVYIAAPVLLWLTGSSASPTASVKTAESPRSGRMEPAR